MNSGDGLGHPNSERCSNGRFPTSPRSCYGQSTADTPVSTGENARAAAGSGDSGPSTEERYAADEAATALRDRGFGVQHEAVRPETFLLVATAE
ncbi:hypothetical protein GCM10009020_04450 [Natronoarchaeum mannanilyticum]|uniref:Uncharacterized protein n=1 Tax=Natronoarchaeum mannanilyticum TaxID=926360 RepID=A0AAV3T7S1_9EURY